MSLLNHGTHFVMARSVLNVIPRLSPQCYGLQISLKHIKYKLDYIKCIYVLFSWSSPVRKLVTALTTVGEIFHVYHGFSHSIANLFLWIMVLPIYNISLQKCYSKSFSAITVVIYHPKCESCLLWKFCCKQYCSKCGLI